MGVLKGRRVQRVHQFGLLLDFFTFSRGVGRF